MQRKALRCPFDKNTGQYDAPGETCLRDLLVAIQPAEVERALAVWMQGLDDAKLRRIAIDGKTIEGAARRDKSFQEDSCQVRNRNAARVLVAFRQMAIFLCEMNAHRVRLKKDERCLPELFRYASFNGIAHVISWFMHPKAFKTGYEYRRNESREIAS